MGKRGMGDFSSVGRGGGGGPKLAPLGIQSIMGPQVSQQAQIGKQNELVQTAVPAAEGVKQQMGGAAPVGTTLTQGGLKQEMNRKLDTGERQDVASARSLEPLVANIRAKVGKGIFNDPAGLGDVGRTMRQAMVDSGHPLATYSDKDLQSLQSDFNGLKTQIPFSFGGKTLTPTEKEVVFRLLNTTGKADNIILKDLDQAMGMIMSKEAIVTGGVNAATSPETSTPGAGDHKIRVRDKVSGRSGQISESKFNPDKYERI